MKVNFLIIGAQKCGTTTLFMILNSHPSLVGSTAKELNFFSLSRDWRAELPNYEKQFKQEAGKLYFEASPSYTLFPGGHSQNAWDRKYPIRNFRVWDDIFDYNPNMKLIYLVRDPVERIISSYFHHYNRGFIRLSLEEAVLKDRLLIDATRYYMQINPYIKKFGRDQVMIIDFDDLVQDRRSVIEDVSSFLGIDFDRFENYEDVHFNASSKTRWKHHQSHQFSLPRRAVRKLAPTIYYRFIEKRLNERSTLSPEFKQLIRQMLEVEIQELGKLMNKDLSKWLPSDS